jgi:hypothetical protein
MSVDQMGFDQNVFDEMVFDQMVFDKKTWRHFLAVEKIQQLNVTRPLGAAIIKPLYEVQP